MSHAVTQSAALTDPIICGIYLTEIAKQDARYTPCGHIYGAAAIQQWLNVKQEQANCPACRAPLRAEWLGSTAKDAENFKIQQACSHQLPQRSVIAPARPPISQSIPSILIDLLTPDEYREETVLYTHLGDPDAGLQRFKNVIEYTDSGGGGYGVHYLDSLSRLWQYWGNRIFYHLEAVHRQQGKIIDRSDYGRQAFIGANRCHATFQEREEAVKRAKTELLIATLIQAIALQKPQETIDKYHLHLCITDRDFELHLDEWVRELSFPMGLELRVERPSHPDHDVVKIAAIIELKRELQREWSAPRSRLSELH